MAHHNPREEEGLGRCGLATTPSTAPPSPRIGGRCPVSSGRLASDLLGIASSLLVFLLGAVSSRPPSSSATNDDARCSRRRAHAAAAARGARRRDRSSSSSSSSHERRTRRLSFHLGREADEDRRNARVDDAEDERARAVAEREPAVPCDEAHAREDVTLQLYYNHITITLQLHCN